MFREIPSRDAIWDFGTPSACNRRINAQSSTVITLQSSSAHFSTVASAQYSPGADTNAPFAAIEDFRDIESHGHYRHAVACGADPETVLQGLHWSGETTPAPPVQWSPGPNAGFTTGTPWIPATPNRDVVNAEAAWADEHSVFHHYRRLIELRHTEPVVALGDFTILLPEHEQVYAFTRQLGEAELLTALQHLRGGGAFQPSLRCCAGRYRGVARQPSRRPSPGRHHQTGPLGSAHRRIQEVAEQS